MHAEHQLRDAVAFVIACNAVGIADRLVDIAADQQRQEGAVAQLDIGRIEPQRRAIIRGGSFGIAHLPGMAGRQIAARDGNAV